MVNEPLALEFPTVVSNCNTIADWESALQHGTLEVNTVDELGFNGFHYAVRRGQLNLVKYLLSRNADIHRHTENATSATPLHLAVESGDMPTLQFLANSRGVSLDAVDGKGLTAAHLAVRSGRLVQLTYLLRLSSSFIDIQDKEGYTLLHTAILFGSYNCMKQVLAQRPNVFLYDKSGMIPIHQSLKTANPHALILLADHDLNQFGKTTRDGQNCMSLATEAGDETLRKVVQQYASMSNFPHWFKSYMWHLSSASWIFIFLGLSWILNFWLLLGLSIFGMRTLYNLMQSESFKTSKNPLIASGLLAAFGAAAIAFIIFIYPSIQSTHPLSLVIIPCFILTAELLRRVYFRDPGYHSYSAEDTIAFALDIKGDNPKPTLCESCLGDRPIRTKHCSKCDRCIEGAQHHCTALNFCVAKNTYLPFILLLASASLSIGLWIRYAFLYLTTLIPETEAASAYNAYATLRLFAQLNPPIVVLCCIAVAVFGYTVVTLGFHLKLISQNLTAYEHANWERYEYMQDESGEFANPYNKGIATNLQQFFMSNSKASDSYKIV